MDDPAPASSRRPAVPPSACPPSPLLASRDVRALGERLVAYHAQFHDLFARREQSQWSAFYLRGQLSDLERKTIEPMVLALVGPDDAAVRAAQQFLGAGAWDDEAILARHQVLVGQSLGEPEGMVIVDGSGFPKQGKHSVGVARQYCGALGKIANCQHGVFAVYHSSAGHTFLDRRLYMPQAWFDEAHAPLRQRYGVPPDLEFMTEPMLALQMVQNLVEHGHVPFRWVLGDETYGADPKFLDGVEELDKCYFVEVPVSTRVWVGEVEVEPPGQGPTGRPRKDPRVAPGTPPLQQVRRIAAQLPPQAWRRYVIQEGTKGPIEATMAFLRVTRSARKGTPRGPAWAVFRRGHNEKGEETLKAFLSNAPAGSRHGELARLSGMRWPIETVLEEGKGEVGMDHYEVRTWRGWQHQMTQTFLAHHFLVLMRLESKKKLRR